MDEVSPFKTTWIYELQENGEILDYTIQAQEFKKIQVNPESIMGSPNPEQEARVLIQTLQGKGEQGRSFTVCLNTAPILYLTGRATSLRQGFSMAEEILYSGQGIEALENWVLCQNHDPESGIERLHSLLNSLRD
jgi:anthranilate phosphoribosyltransferase